MQDAKKKFEAFCRSQMSSQCRDVEGAAYKRGSYEKEFISKNSVTLHRPRGMKNKVPI